MRRDLHRVDRKLDVYVPFDLPSTGLIDEFFGWVRSSVTPSDASGTDMRRYFSFCGALALTFTDLAVAIAEENGKWELEQRRSFIFTLSYKQSASINNQTATSELAFICDQRNRLGIIGVILVPFDGTFENHQDPIPVLCHFHFPC